MKIFLVGPMGSGKSKIGKLLSSEINLNLIDIDKEIEAKFEKTIVEIFASEGEEGFRDKEINFLEKIVLKGIKTNIPFLISLLKDKNFINGTHNTKYIENNLNTLTSEIISDKNTLSEVAIDKKRIKIVESDKLKIVNNRSETETGGIKVVYFD